MRVVVVSTRLCANINIYLFYFTYYANNIEIFVYCLKICLFI